MISLHFEGDYYYVHESELSTDLYEMLLLCGGSGEQSANVQSVMDSFKITGEKTDCQKYLRQYGTWTDDELTDHQTNLERLVWLAGCDLKEQGEIRFSVYE